MKSANIEGNAQDPRVKYVVLGDGKAQRGARTKIGEDCDSLSRNTIDSFLAKLWFIIK